MHRHHGLVYNKIRGFHAKFTGFNEFGNYLSMVKPVDRVQGTVDRWRGRVHGGPISGADTRHGGVLLPCDTVGAVVLGSSPAKAGEEEDDEAEPMRGS
jgi:hypothetical protein